MNQAFGNRTDTGPMLFAEAATPPLRGEQATGSVIACVSDRSDSQAILSHALAAAKALDAPVAAARVIETPLHWRAPCDPLEWKVQRSESLERLDRLVKAAGSVAISIKQVLLAGPAADQLIGWAKSDHAALLVLGDRDRDEQRAGLGATAQKLLEQTSTSLLLVPEGKSRLPYRRVLVPLDGSNRAESVVPIAARIARAHGAEMLLVHIVPRPSMLGKTSEARSNELCSELVGRNEREARSYLQTLEVRLRREQLQVRSIVSSNGDPRPELRRLANEQQADLIVAASHGWSGMTDLPCGSVTDYLAKYARAPLLIVRPDFVHVFAESFSPAKQQVESPAPEHA